MNELLNKEQEKQIAKETRINKLKRKNISERASLYIHFENNTLNNLLFYMEANKNNILSREEYFLVDKMKECIIAIVMMRDIDKGDYYYYDHMIKKFYEYIEKINTISKNSNITSKLIEIKHYMEKYYFEELNDLEKYLIPDIDMNEGFGYYFYNMIVELLNNSTKKYEGLEDKNFIDMIEKNIGLSRLEYYYIIKSYKTDKMINISKKGLKYKILKFIKNIKNGGIIHVNR